jgi:arabinose-5-phosphate isomerase
MDDKTACDIASEVIATEIFALQSLIAQFDQEFDAVADVISSLSGKLVVTGMGKAGLIGQKIAALGKGFRPPRIRPQNLKAYYPGVGNLVDVVGGRTLVKQAGTDTFADHPRVF